jgi:prolyl 4-hydroxylase
MAEAALTMGRSLVINRDSSGAIPDATRTSSGMHFERGASAVADDLQRRLMGIIGMPIEYGEPLQVLRYGPGEVYEPHFDYFTDDGSPESTLAMNGQRIATLICYLADVEFGGATVFPTAGFEVRPSQGRAVYFSDVHQDGSVDPETLHGGAPVGSGEKWIVTQWCRDRPYCQPAE